MRRLAIPSIAAAILVAGGAVAFAHQAGPEGDLPGRGIAPPFEFAPDAGGGGAFNPGRHIDGRVAFLKAELKITPTQEPAWARVETVLREQAQSRAAWHEKMQAERKARQQPPALPERLDRAEEMSKRRQADLAALKQAIAPLYMSFTAEQKATADEIMMPGPRPWQAARREREGR